MTRKAPIRTCIACHASSDKRALVRFVRTADGTVALDASGKAAGRGAYVCADEACFARACDKRLLGGRLRTKVGHDDYERLRADFDVYMSAVGATSAGDR